MHVDTKSERAGGYGYKHLIYSMLRIPQIFIKYKSFWQENFTEIHTYNLNLRFHSTCVIF